MSRVRGKKFRIAGWAQRTGFLVVLVMLAFGLATERAHAMSEQASSTRSSEETAGLPDKPPKPFDWVDTSSPRGVLESLLTGTKRYYDLIRNKGFTRQNRRELSNISEQAERLFDLRGVPPGHVHDVAHETTVLLREALARVPLPKSGEVPDEGAMATRIKEGKSPIYRVRGTPFEIARTDTGPDAGRYQFTHDTVDHARDFYEEIKAYPHQPGQADVKGYYEAYFSSPGPLISRAWIGGLPAWMQHEFLEQTFWQWLFLIGGVLFFTATICLLHVGINRISRKWDRLNRHLILLLRPIAAILLALILARFLDDDVRLTGEVARIVETGKHLIVLFASVIVTMELGNVVAKFILTVMRFGHGLIDQQLIRLFVRLLSVVIAVVIVIEEMQ